MTAIYYVLGSLALVVAVLFAMNVDADRAKRRQDKAYEEDGK